MVLQKPDLEIVKVEPQKELHNFAGRSVIVDALCTNSIGELFNIEIQKSDDTDHVKRVRYNAANVDTAMSRKGVDFDELKDIYIVYISRFDLFRRGRTIYHADRIIRETGDMVDDGIHMVYINTKVDDGTEIAELMKIFDSHEIPDNEKFSNIIKAIRDLKKGEERETMCTLVEEYAKKVAEEAEQSKAREIAVSLIQVGVDEEKISQATKLSIEVVQELRASLTEH